MSAKSKSVYTCDACGSQHRKWLGQCPDCDAWNSLSETPNIVVKKAQSARFSSYAGDNATAVINLAEVPSEDQQRTPSGSQEFDRVLGGGLVAGAVILIGGDPGVGKSTLLLQTLARLSQQQSVLYVSGEESPQQVSLRAKQLGLNDPAIQLLAETHVEQIIAQAQKLSPQIVVIDSIQTIYTDMLQSAPGSVSQVRESAAQLVRFAKQTGTTLLIVGHVTKDGQLAGPRVLEHMVDTVLYFEGERDGRIRMLRAVKNRFGAVNELGVFAMTDKGLREVNNPSAIFLSGYDQKVPGSVVMVTWEGSRPLLVEVQALVDSSHLPQPRRVTVGMEHNRMAMLLAVLHRHAGIASYDQDVFVNVVGGVKVTETAADLALLCAIISSLKNKPLFTDTVVFGEIGLSGEIRPVPSGAERLKAAEKHGFKRAIIPHGNKPKTSNLEIIAIQRLDELLTHLAS